MGEPNGIIAIAVNDERLHLYPDVAALLGTVQTFTTGALDFFDLAGHRLAPVYGERWTLDDLRPTGEPDAPAVRGRMAAVLRFACDEYDRRVASGEPPMDVEPLTRDLVDLDLPGSFDRFFQAGFGHRLLPPGREDRRDPWHNFWAHRVG